MEIRRLRGKYMTSAALDDACMSTKAAVQLNPDDLDLRQSLARLLLERKDYPGAIDQWRRLLARFPEMADWHVNLGVVLSASGDEAQALTQFEAAGAINPYLRATARFSSGNALMAQGKTAEAEQQYREALEPNSLMPKAENALGVILANQGKAAEAEQAFRRAVEVTRPSSRPASTWPP